MGGLKFAVNAVKRMRNRMRDLRGLEVALQVKDIVADAFDFAVLLLLKFPRQGRAILHWILRKIGCNLFTDKSVRQICNLQTALDRIVISDRDVIHPALQQLPMQLLADQSSYRENRNDGTAIPPERAVAQSEYVRSHLLILQPLRPAISLCSATQSR